MNDINSLPKAFILDTNVLVHDSSALKGFKDNVVILPITVIEELDKIKKYRDELGYNARAVARYINELSKRGDISEGVEVNEEGGKLMVMMVDQSDWPYGLIKEKNDNFIIKAAYDTNKLKSIKYKEVIFVSKDFYARIKASALGIDVQDYEKQKVKIDRFEKGWAEFKVTSDIINEFYEAKSISISKIDVEGKFQFYPNCYIKLTDIGNQKHSAIGRYNYRTKTIEPLKFFQEKRSIWGIKALNLEQRFVFDALLDPSIFLVTLVGQAGTGKTLLALASGLKQTLDDGIYKKILVSRPIVPLGKDIGYLPGSKDEKLSVWMQPIFDNLYLILNQTGNTSISDTNFKTKKRGSLGVVDYFIETGIIELAAVTYIRGRTIPQQYIIIDEAQNLTPHEVKTIISRVGMSSKIILTGDPFQIDNPYLDAESNGLIYVAERFKGVDIAAHIVLKKTERSKLATLAAELL